MAKIRKQEKKSVPAVSTASLPDIIFMLLFFFMVSTSIKEVTYKVNIRVPEATELQKLEKKSLVRYIYVGEPRPEFQKQYGKETRIQLDDSFAELNEIEMFIENERNAMKENEQGLLTVSIKADKETKMGIITDIKQALRRAQALKINYAAVQRTSY
ncbi:MAG: biopolymer transporter ExbD [Bacteroidales bacterium]|nr:biopolymer transporter ExbD [Bacteroidales bacterium]MDD5975374.1 biopolymer transporter ExbD [Bacteroidales bacterium]MDY5193482.1 biopolymer transporter ExbD [Candidatus Aphodosoma sp.]